MIKNPSEFSMHYGRDGWYVNVDDNGRSKITSYDIVDNNFFL